MDKQTCVRNKDIITLLTRIKDIIVNLPKNEMETILNGIKDFILIISPDHEILNVNDAFLNHMDYSRSDVVGRKCYEVFNEKARKGSSNCHHKCPLEKAIREKRHCTEELIRIDGKGHPRYTELTIFPIWETKGKISRFIEISRDITQRKTDEKQTRDHLLKMVEERTRQLKESHERLLHQDKMASLGKLSSSVVHEINNPVAGILNLVMLIKRILNEDGIQENEIALFRQYLDLLVFARQSKLEVVKFDVNDLIEDLEHNLPLLLSSEDQIRQVIMNLISNAVESMTQVPKKRLTIQTRSSPEKEAVEIRISDTGTGIPKETISRIFEPFFTTKGPGKGTGLGASISFNIVKDYGGTIEIKR